MKKILLLGAGRSSIYLIEYLSRYANKDAYEICIADLSEEGAKAKAMGLSGVKTIVLDAREDEARRNAISESDLVISMLPAFMHGPVAKDCVGLKKHLVTASYVSDEMKMLESDAKSSGVLLLNEMGLDPGLDHMSAMQIIDRIKKEGGEITSFRSYCGGLVAPESNDNPWGYKFSWNPRNVIVAGQGTARYLQDGVLKFKPYHRLFAEHDVFSVEGLGKFDGYVNRDSLSYLDAYGLSSIKTLIRGTLRQEGFCEAWQVFVSSGLTDDSFKIHLPKNFTYADLVRSLLPDSSEGLAEAMVNLTSVKNRKKTIDMIRWTGVCDEKIVGLDSASPAEILQKLLEEKWKLMPSDKDMIVMQHLFEYSLDGQNKRVESSLVLKGEDSIHTAMARTVGLPLAVGVRKIIQGKIELSGVHIPVIPQIYEPVLSELNETGLFFTEKEY